MTGSACAVYRGRRRVGVMMPKDDAEDVNWYRKAADWGLASAQFNLGYMYANERGMAKDDAEAVEWYRKAADQGLAAAQNSLGIMYYDGQGVAKDEVEAYKWFLLAGAQGHETAKSNITIIERGLTAAQKANGQKRAREFKPVKAAP